MPKEQTKTIMLPPTCSSGGVDQIHLDEIRNGGVELTLSSSAKPNGYSFIIPKEKRREMAEFLLRGSE